LNFAALVTSSVNHSGSLAEQRDPIASARHIVCFPAHCGCNRPLSVSQLSVSVSLA
jgi:hypothetical protein